MISTLGLFGTIGTWEAVAILAVGLLLFGRRLPEVGRSLGRGIVEFKKGLKGIEEEIDTQSKAPASGSTRPPLTDGGHDARMSRSDAAKVEAPQG
jgi:TatA/E family protein of Tat protein translocase